MTMAAGVAQEGQTIEPFFSLPPGLLASENLTRQVGLAASSAESPFEGEPQYDRLFEGLARALHAQSPRHVLLAGERGVGQSAVMVEFARQAAAGKFPFLQQKQIISANARFVPRDISRAAIDWLFSRIGIEPELVVCLDGLCSLLHSDADNRLRFFGALARSHCRVIGLVSPQEFEDCFAGHPDSLEFFTAITIQEPDVHVATKLLVHMARGLEQSYGVTIDRAAIHRAVGLADSYVLHERLPLKALRLLHRECDDIRFDRTQLGRERLCVTEEDIVRRISSVSGIPEHTLSGVGESADYRASLNELIIGQDQAVGEIATELGLIKAGLTDRSKPASVMLFAGPTGTGKTEMAKVLARLYSASKRLKTYTLGNFAEPHSVSGIIGVPAGYVGHDQGGRLVNDLNSDPYGVFLFDEADKAHPDVLQPLLNLFDEGWINDQRGVRAYADRAIFILTTNVGQRQLVEMFREGKSVEEVTATMKETLSRIRHAKADRPIFTPEFLARLRRVVIFRPLDCLAMTGITRKLLRELVVDWQVKRSKELIISQAICEQIAQEAHRRNDASKDREGGRVVHKLIADVVQTALQRAIGRDPSRYQRSRRITIDLADQTLSGERARSLECVVSFI